MKRTLSSLIAIGFVTIVIACGKGEIGDSCGKAGDTDACESGAICGQSNDPNKPLVCQQICKEQTDCPPTHDCNGVEGSSTKGCRLKLSSGTGK
jgi:hypothetical protein